MDQRSKNKVKLFRTLKVVFYALGLPLFAFAVVITAATEYVGEFAYNGSAATELFASMKVLFNGTALYGVWVAAGVWLLIAVIHIILTKTVKNRRARTLLVGIVTLVVMLAPVIVMDLVIPVKLDSIAAELPEGVTIASYQDEKGHFYTRTSASWTPSGKYESNNYYFVTGVENFLKTYNIGMYGGTKSGTANNTVNAPVTFGELFDDAKGEAPFAGAKFKDKYVKPDTTVTVEDETATVTTNGNGQLVVNDIVFENYVLGASNGMWYRKELGAEMKDGAYGYGSYNYNGQLSDGYVYGIDSALAILEDYYYSQKRMTEISNELTLASNASALPSNETIIAKATELREEYYTLKDSGATAYEQWVWGEQANIAGKYSLTQGELENVLDALGTALGENGLGPALKNLINGLVGSVLTGLNIAGVDIKKTDGVTGLRIVIKGDETTTDDDITITVTIAPWEDAETGRNSGGKDALNISLSGIAGGEYHLGLDSRLISGLSELLDSLVVNANILRVEATGTTPAVYYKSVAEIVYDVLNGGGTGTIGTVGTIFGLVGGLISIIGDITGLITIETNENGEVTTTTEEMLYGLVGNLLEGLYWYSSPVIKPAYEFYEQAAEELATGTDETKALVKEYGKQLADYDRAVYEGGMHGYMIGSVIIPGSSLIAGDTLGNGSYSATVPASYEEVILLKTELSYKRWLYPLLGVRECLVCFVPFVVLFILLSGVAAEKEMLYATEQETAKKSKKDKKKEEEAAKEEADIIASEAAEEQVTESTVPEEGAAPLAEENNDKEVL